MHWVVISIGTLTRNGHVVNDAARFDTENNIWEDIAAIQVERFDAFGAAANGKVYIAGGDTYVEEVMILSC